ncbi:arginase family protein [Neptunicella marina]|uniref:Arginase family protein n=1 Tax=Neptunicella marina TaxID=2125989 RepID=A0A8J6M254_9ALTE|nr:arginase family protein [Neptunicella marina]MBC3765952.1 arginase family protein [Neptunicella marina]
MTFELDLATDTWLKSVVSCRAGEFKTGQKIRLLSDGLSLQNAAQHGIKYVVFGVPEDIGPRANLGRGGANKAWSAFCRYFLNLQANRFLAADNILLLGELKVPLCESNKPDNLRAACNELDQSVFELAKTCFDSGLIPIIIGGGHNNAYPIIKACSQSSEQKLAVVNLDPHSDFRPMEGRHSGNPFRYAHHQGYLEHYAVVGLHEQKNSDDALNAMQQAGFRYFSIQQWLWQQQISWSQIVEQTTTYLTKNKQPIGIELDVDAISTMPSSALTHCGVSVTDAMRYVSQFSTLPNVRYLHLAEGAPEHHPAGVDAGMVQVGQTLAELVSAFVKAR